MDLLPLTSRRNYLKSVIENKSAPEAAKNNAKAELAKVEKRIKQTRILHANVYIEQQKQLEQDCTEACSIDEEPKAKRGRKPKTEVTE